MFFLAKGTFNIVGKVIQSRKDMNMVETELDSAKKRESELNSSIDELSTPSGIEKEIRQRYNVKKENEEVVIIVDNKASSTSAIRSESVLKKVWNWFVNIF